MSDKTCPYCSESIKERPIKCRYCHSMLLPHSGLPGSSNQDKVTYVLDRDLIRFAKFSLAVLALFTVVGMFLFGIDLKRVRDEVTNAASDVEDARKNVADNQARAESQSEQLTKLVNSMGEQFQKTKAEADAARVTSEQAKTSVANLRNELTKIGRIRRQYEELLVTVSLTSAERAKINEIRSTPERRDRGRLWNIGETIRIRFIGGISTDHTAIILAARAWEEVANIEFELVDEGDAEIRVAFRRGEGTWSQVGTDALATPEDEPTTNFGWPLDSDEGKATILHEFGHVLGLLHEHQNPNATFSWDKEAVLMEMSGAPNHWTKQNIEHNMFRTWSDDDSLRSKPYDERSIMHYVFRGEWFVDGKQRGGAQTLSKTDKDFISKLYPAK